MVMNMGRAQLHRRIALPPLVVLAAALALTRRDQAVIMVAFGIWLVAVSSGPGGRALGGWIIGSGLNYAPLAAYAIALSRPGALEAELAGVDIGRELRRYSLLQLWIFVPLTLVVLAVRSVLGQRAEL